MAKRKSITLTGVRAAVRQIEAAIDHWEKNEFDIATTLAGAAEGMIVSARGIFDYQRNHPRVKEVLKMTPIEYADQLNRERNWLKHPPRHKTMRFTEYSAAFMIARALSKLKPKRCTTRIRNFWDGWVATYK
jgi:hypothetical protein